MSTDPSAATLPFVMPTMATMNSQIDMPTAPQNSIGRRPARSTNRIPGMVHTTLTTLVTIETTKGSEMPDCLKNVVPLAGVSGDTVHILHRIRKEWQYVQVEDKVDTCELGERLDGDTSQAPKPHAVGTSVEELGISGRTKSSLCLETFAEDFELAVELWAVE
jgi:hypothetical protein